MIDVDQRMQMIYQKAGITDLFTTEAITIEESVKKLAALPLHHHPGKESGQARGGMGSAGTFNWGGYFNSQYFADPQEQIIGVILKQTQGPVKDATGWKFRQMVFQTLDD